MIIGELKLTNNSIKFYDESECEGEINGLELSENIDLGNISRYSWVYRYI